MPSITVDGIKTFEVEAGKKLVLAIEDNEIDILHRCGGICRCTTCRVVLLEGDAGPMGELEQERLARETNLDEGTRLSCQIRVQSDLKVKVLKRACETGLAPGTRPED